MPPSVVDRINGRLRRVPPWLLYVVATLPPVGLLWFGATGGLGVEPVEVIEHRLGEWGLQVLIATLCVTPARRLAGLNLLRFRRALGQIGFAYILLHLLTWLFLDVQIWSQIWADVLKRPYITIGMAGFVSMVPLAATSTDRALRRLGTKAWRRLHKLTYAAVTLGAMHWVMLAKGWQMEPILYLSAVLGLLALRVRPARLLDAVTR